MSSPSETKQYFGKYRGTVINNVDPQGIGRVQVQVPDVLGIAISSWALPCFPFTGTQVGFFCIPMIGAGVWVEFEQGNQDYPIWCGGFYGSRAEIPSMANLLPPGLPGVVIQSGVNHGMSISNMPAPPGGIAFSTTAGTTMHLTDTIVNIQDGKGADITMAGTAVTINRDGLVVTF